MFKYFFVLCRAYAYAASLMAVKVKTGGTSRRVTYSEVA